MAQYGRPITPDISTGNWTTTPLWSKLDEASYDDADYAQLNNSTSSNFEVKLSSITDPVSATGHIVRIRVKKTGTGTISEVGYLYQGTTLIATITISLTTAYNTIEYTLSAAEANAITDYTDLRVRVNGVAASSSRYAYVSWIEMEVPNASTPVSSSYHAYIRGASSTTSSFPVYIKGKALATPSQFPAYIKGIGQASSSFHVFIQGKASSLSSFHAYIFGAIPVTSSYHAYINGVNQIVGSFHAFVEGYEIPHAESSFSAFIIGVENFIYPSGVYGVQGTWENEFGSQVNIWLSIDDFPISDDEDFIYPEDPQAEDYYECRLSSGSPLPGDVVVFFRGNDDYGSGNSQVEIQFRQETTVIASKAQVLTAIPATYYLQLTPAEKANITDWSKLRVRIRVGAI